MDGELLAERFEAERSRLQGVAYRLLGSTSEADDAVQEAWIRLSRSDTSEVENLSGWLTTVVSRVCLDMLRSRRTRREDSLEEDNNALVIPDAANPEADAVLAEQVGIAMLAVLQKLAPAERVAFVLHDVFGVSFDEIAEIVDRSPVATRQLASRGRRRVQGVSDDEPSSEVASHREVVEAFFRASRDGDLPALLAVLAPDVVVRPDAEALRMGMRTGWISSELRGATAVAERFNGSAQAAQVALLDGVPGGLWAANGKPVIFFSFVIEDGKVVEIELVADRERLDSTTVEVLD